MLTRRRLLGGLGILGGLGVVGGAATQVPAGPVSEWTPPTDTWPLQQYDTARTATTDANVPFNPSIDWERTVLETGGTHGIVADEHRVYATGGGLVALDRDGGETEWEQSVTGGRVGVRDGTVFTAPEPASFGTDGALAAFLADDGAEQWRFDGVSEAASLLVGEHTVFVGGESELVAVGASDGDLAWTRRDVGARGARPLLVKNTLYTGGDGVSEFGMRSLLDAAAGSPPGRDWSADVGTVTEVAATDRYLVAGTAESGLVCYDRQNRTLEWTALDTDAAAVDALAIDGTRCLAGVRQGGPAVAAVDLRNGNPIWREPLDGAVTDLVAVDGEVVVATEADAVRSFGRKPGRQAWRVRLFEVSALAPVDRTIFAVTNGGTVAAIRE